MLENEVENQEIEIDLTGAGTTSKNESEKNTVEEDDPSKYSEKVQKRINKITRKLREAEERAAAAEHYAQELENKQKSVKTDTLAAAQQKKAEVENHKRNLEEKLALARKAKEDAFEAGDKAALREADDIILSATLDIREANNWLSGYDNWEKNQGKTVENNSQEPQPKPKAKANPQVEAFVEKHSDWWGVDEEATAFALIVERRLRKEGKLDPENEEFYEAIEKELVSRGFLEKENDREEETRKKPPVVTGNGSSRATNGKVKVKPTERQIQAAKSLGVPLETYIKNEILAKNQKDKSGYTPIQIKRGE